MYAKLWEKDCLAKSKREEMETALRLERNKETLDVSVCMPMVIVFSIH